MNGADGTALALGTELHLAASSETALYTISGHMKETAGNEYQGLAIENISITVTATQDTVEHDSIGNQYDAKAWEVLDTTEHLKALQAEGYKPTKTDTELKTALENDDKVVLSSDVAVEDKIQLSILKDTAIDFNGNTLTGTVMNGSFISDPSSVNLVLSDPMNDGSKYTIDGAINPTDGGGFTQYATIWAMKPTVTVESGRYTHDNKVVSCQLQTSDPNAVGVVINGGTFDGKGSASVIENVIGTVIINGGNFNANTNTETNSGGACFILDWGDTRVPTKTIVNGGTFTADAAMFYIIPEEGYTQKLEVNGGTFILDEEDTSFVLTSDGSSAKDILVITGGTFNVDPSEYVDTSAYKVTEKDGMWTVTAK